MEHTGRGVTSNCFNSGLNSLALHGNDKVLVYSNLVKPLFLVENEVLTVFVSYFIDFVCQAENCSEVAASPEH